MPLSHLTKSTISQVSQKSFPTVDLLELVPKQNSHRALGYYLCLLIMSTAPVPQPLALPCLRNWISNWSIDRSHRDLSVCFLMVSHNLFLYL